MPARGLGAADVEGRAGRDEQVLPVELEVEVLEGLVGDVGAVEEDTLDVPVPQILRREHRCRVPDQLGRMPGSVRVGGEDGVGEHEEALGDRVVAGAELLLAAGQRHPVVVVGVLDRLVARGSNEDRVGQPADLRQHNHAGLGRCDEPALGYRYDFK